MTRWDHERFVQENQKQQELDDTALATNDDAVIRARAKEAWEWMHTSPYSPLKLLGRADALALKAFGKRFSEMDPDEFNKPE
jgi:hypothetical protein